MAQKNNWKVRDSIYRESFHRACCSGNIASRRVTRQQNNILTLIHSFVDTYCKLVTSATILLTLINVRNELVLSGVWLHQSLKNGYMIYRYHCEMEMKGTARPVHGHSFTRHHLASSVSICPSQSKAFCTVSASKKQVLLLLLPDSC
jgi:hypothetical protein